MSKVKQNCALGLTLGLALSACAPGSQERVDETTGAVVSNGSFETSTAGMAPQAPWTIQTFLNKGITVQTPQTRAGLNLRAGGKALTTVLKGVNQPDPDLGVGASLRWPRYGTQCALVNQHGNNSNVNSLSQTMIIGAGDVDPADGQVHLRFAVAPVLQNPAHPATEQPYYFVQVTNVTQGTLLYSDFNLSAQAGVPWKTVNGGTNKEIDYVDWSLVDVAPGTAKLAIGDTVLLELMASGCSPGGHFGELYVDGVGTTVPGLFVSGTGPAQANAGTNITYALTYKNGSAGAETGVVIDFNTPPNTTFQGLTPPAGAACTTPAVGAAGIIVCTFAGPIAAGSSGTFSVTVGINAAATGQIVCGNYAIESTQETPLLGSHIVTKIGCALDSDCSAGQWCSESTNSCLPTLTNGTAIPKDGPHTNPTLNGTCTAAASALVCSAGVCETSDNKCGDLNGDGPCTVATGAKICRSGVCDPDNKCGYAVGDGPCSAATAGTVCRSGACSANKFCEPAGGCNVDADCAAGNWCKESTHACTAKLSNGTTVPIDAPHTAPTLNGTCTPAVGALVCSSGVCDTTDNKCGALNGDGPCTVATEAKICRSGVCDPDNKCGYAVDDGPCNATNASTVCRSTLCSLNGVCEPSGGCNVDADCTGGNWCDESSHTCSPKLSNGTAIPTDTPHAAPALKGICSAAAALLVCQSGVCDGTDNKCGYALNDGPCTTANGATVCRSSACSSNGVCEPSGGCNADADCPAGKWCNENMNACLATLPNAAPVPTDAPHTNPTLNGTCTAAAGALVCSSAVCDTKDNGCGYENGVGPCTAADAATVCRSSFCATTGSNPGTCVGCTMDSQCPSTSPVCNTSNGICVGCVTSSQCMGATPVCETSSSSCEPCDGDNGAATPRACSTTAAPFCFLSGAALGTCGKCAQDADCQGHTGNICDTGSGLCVTGCHADSDCDASHWCTGTTDTLGSCVPKLENGTPLPSTPATVMTCSPDVGMRVCVSAVCDPKDNACGLAPGDGSCTDSEQCRNDTCDQTTMTCTTTTASGCMSDADCPSADFCPSDGTCTPKLPMGTTCAGPNQCQSGNCTDAVCSTIVGLGGGCAMRPTGGSNGSGAAGMFALLLAAVSIARRRRS
ncbi:MAG TPA: hypothetical protein VHW01_22005 [Polyangiaceae bacterium]|jgi:hypothetical protein|nr:hypothetical protein [Polyangiaceae bacterium]